MHNALSCKTVAMNDGERLVTGGVDLVCIYCKRAVRPSSMPTGQDGKDAATALPVSHVACGVCWLALAPTEDEYIARVIDLYEVHVKPILNKSI